MQYLSKFNDLFGSNRKTSSKIHMEMKEAPNNQNDLDKINIEDSFFNFKT